MTQEERAEYSKFLKEVAASRGATDKVRVEAIKALIMLYEMWRKNA